MNCTRKAKINGNRARDPAGRFVESGLQRRAITLRLDQQAYELLELICDIQCRSQSDVVASALRLLYTSLI